MGAQPGTGENRQTGRNILVDTNNVSGTGSRVFEGRPARGLILTIEQGADDWLASKQPATDTLPADLTIVSVGDAHRSTAASSNSGIQIPQTPPATPTIGTIPDATNLSSLALTITEYLNGVPEAEGRAETMLLVDSLNGLLEDVPLHRVFRFLHVITAFVRESGATAYYRLDESTLDAESVVSIRMLFD